MSRSLLEQAIGQHRRGQLDGAERDYRSVLSQMPDEPDALALLGVLLGERGLYRQAIELIERAIRLDPKAALFHLHLGNVQMEMGDLPHAADAFRKAVSLDPSLAPAYYNLGNVLAKMGAFGEAEIAYARALELKPSYAEARNNLALIYERKGDVARAVEELQRAVTDQPDYGEGWLNLCKLCEKTGDFTAALAAGEKATMLMPQNAAAWHHLGVVFNRLEQHEKAEKAYKIALGLRPDTPESWDNLGLTYQFMNRLDEAEAAFRKMIDLAGETVADEDVRKIDEGDFSMRHWHLAQLELMRGNYARGFGRYRCRFSACGGLKRFDVKQPFWRGEDIEGKIVLVHDEKGYGDGLMMCRYLPLMRERGAHVIFRVKPAFGPLFKNWDGADEVILGDENCDNFDFYTWVFDLPYIFGTTLETIPSRVPYLPLLAPDEHTKLASDTRPRIGIVWAGSKDQPFYRRQIPLEALADLFAEENCVFYNLTLDKRKGDDAVLASYPLIDLAPRLRHFGDLARFITQMDLIITCDTATPHLAGGLGKEVWTLLPFSCDWRWLTHREDSPWYPTMRLFRQSKTGDWEELLKRVNVALKEWLRARGLETK